MSVFPCIAQAHATHLLRLALSLSPEPYATQNTSQYQSYAQPPAISNPDDLGFDFLTTAENSPLPVAHHSLAHDLPYENGESIYYLSKPTRPLTIRNIAWPRYLQSDLPYFNKPPFSQVTVSGSVVVVPVIAYTIP